MIRGRLLYKWRLHNFSPDSLSREKKQPKRLSKFCENVKQRARNRPFHCPTSNHHYIFSLPSYMT